MKTICISAMALLLFGIARAQTSPFEARFRAAGLVDITVIDPDIKVELIYSTTNNFAGKDMYGSLEKAYLVPEIARAVAAAQRDLQKLHPGYSLIIYDAARPMSVQRQMFRLVAGTPQNIYVANPAKGGGRHNYGVAVDISILDERGVPLDMGCPVDFFGPAAHTDNETDLVGRGVITAQARRNRDLLRRILHAQGLVQHPKEWWHFHKYSMQELRERYVLLDF